MPLTRLAVGLALALLSHAHAAANEPKEGRAAEITLQATSPTAAVRSGGSGALQVTLWYPAIEGAVERDILVGDAQAPVFRAGRAAAGAPWRKGGRLPLVVLLHGFGGSARQMTWLGTALARYGFVAAAVDHPGTNGLEPITPEGVYAPWERAHDLRLVIDRLLSDPVIGPRIDKSRIAAAGFSLGGWTAVLLAGGMPDFDHFRDFCASTQRDEICEPQREYPVDFKQQPALLAKPHAVLLAAGARQSQRDERVRSVVLLAPALGKALARDSLHAIDVPVLVIAGDADRVTPVSTNASLIAASIPEAQLEVMRGVGHYTFLSPCGEAGLRHAAPYCTDGPGIDRESVHRQTLDRIVRFLRTALR
jgi:predicted dienelactone hydrolase